MAILEKDPISGGYVVRAGDSLSKIASSQGRTLAELLATNPQFASNPNLIRPGDVVKVAPQTPATPPPTAPTMPPDTRSYENLAPGTPPPSTPPQQPKTSFTQALTEILSKAQQGRQEGTANLLKQKQDITQKGLDMASQVSNIENLSPEGRMGLRTNSINAVNPGELSVENQLRLANAGYADANQLIEQVLGAYESEQERLAEQNKPTARATSVVEAGGHRLLIDDATGETIKDLGVAGTTTTSADQKIVTIDGKQYVQNADGTFDVPTLPDAPPTTQKVEQATNVISQIDDLLNDPNLGRAIGPISSQIPQIIRTGGRNEVDAKINSLIANLALENLSLLKGPMSDKDIVFIKEASSRLKTNVTEEGFKRELNNLKAKFEEIKSRAAQEDQGGGETKEINGVQYRKVDGGWQKVSFNSGGAATNRPQRNNNPLNIKASNFTSKFSGVSGVDPSPASDGGKFLTFDSPDAGFNAAKQLLTSTIYSNLPVDQAMRKWSGGGYGGEIVPELRSKVVAKLTPSEVDSLIKTMAQREGYNA